MSTSEVAPELPPYIVGVTGLMEIHPDDRAPVAQALREVLLWVRPPKDGAPGPHPVLGKNLPLAATTPVVLMSSLAPGADQLAVEVAASLNFGILAPLPFPASKYPDSSTFRRERKDESNPPRPILDPDGLPTLSDEDRARQAVVRGLIGGLPHGNCFHVQLAEDVARSEADLERVLEADLRDRHRRNLRYRAAGEFVAAFSDILIAICDQESQESPTEDDPRLEPFEQSGTRHIVRVRLEGATPGILPIQTALTWADNGPVIRIFARRTPKNRGAVSGAQANPSASTKPGPLGGDVAVWHPFDSRPHSFTPEEWEEREMLHLRQTAHRIASLGEQLRDGEPVKVADALGELLPPAGAVKPFFPTALLASWIEVLLVGLGIRRASSSPGHAAPPVSAKLERLAVFRARVTDRNRNYYDPRVKFLARVYFACALLGGLLLLGADAWVSATAPGTTAPTWVRWFQGGCFLMAMGVFGFAYRRNAGKKKVRLDEWQNDTRALGEALRVQFYWSAAGTGASVASSYLQRARNEVSWLRAAVSAFSFPYETDRADFAKLGGPGQLDRLRRITTGWLHGQLRFFESRVDEFKRRKEGLHYFGNLFLFAGSGLMVFNFAAHPVRFGPLLEPIAEAIGVRGLEIWPGVFASGWLILQFLHMKALQHHRVRTVSRSSADAALAVPGGQPEQPPVPSASHPSGASGGADRKRGWNWIRTYHRVHHVAEHWVMALLLGFTLGIFVATAIYGHHRPHPWYAEPERIGLIAKVMLFSLGFLLHWWVGLKFLGQNVRRYTAMAGLYRGAVDRAEALLDTLESQILPTETSTRVRLLVATPPRQGPDATIAAIQDLYVAIGREALNENADWLLMHRDHPLEPLPPGG